MVSAHKVIDVFNMVYIPLPHLNVILHMYIMDIDCKL